MESSLNPQKRKRHLFFIKALVAANALSIVFGILYFVTNASHWMWNLYGVILLMTLIGNMIITLFKSKHTTLDYLYLFLTIVVMVIVPIMNRMVSTDVTNMTSRSPVTMFLIFTLLVFGGIIAILKWRYHRTSEGSAYHAHTKKLTYTKTVIKIGIIMLLGIIIIIGVYFSYQLVIGKSRNLVELFGPQYALFFSIIFLAITALILKMYSYKNKPFVNFLVILIGITVSVILSLPLLTTPFTIHKAEFSYSEAFGEDPNNVIPIEEQRHFSDTPFSLPNYFFGTASDDYRVEQDILYYEGTTGVDEGILLHFDAYMPPDNQDDLPGNHSVLIRIHGGGWTTGDKGASNSAQVNKYFASQGYVVFDVQYGLSHEQKLFEFSKVPENVVGGFSIDDMVRHIGLFTDYLVEHCSDYEANLDSVFVSGGSAGGQLANAVGLGLASGQYDDLNPQLNVRGIIPIYPANGLAPKVNVEGTNELTDPSLLVTEDSPPALIYQGTHDGLVDQSVSVKFDQTYDEKGKSNSALILMPFAGHSSNSYFPGYYNQVFIYYMERFMYQFSAG